MAMVPYSQSNFGERPNASIRSYPMIKEPMRTRLSTTYQKFSGVCRPITKPHLRICSDKPFYKTGNGGFAISSAATLR